MKKLPYWHPSIQGRGFIRIQNYRVALGQRLENRRLLNPNKKREDDRL